MITNIVMLTYGRPRLTEQALRTLRENTDPNLYTLTTFDDEGKMGTGGARNEAIRRVTDDWQRGDYLYLSDNDVAFKVLWLDILIAAYKFGRQTLSLGALGGYCHPYHQPYEKHQIGMNNSFEIIRPERPNWRPSMEIGITWALPTQSMLMSWEIWDRYKPFADTPPGKVQQSEDWNFTEKLRADGFRVGAIYPPVVLSTGLHNTFGELVVGHEVIQKELEQAKLTNPSLSWE